jgi:hypothetical protein
LGTPVNDPRTATRAGSAQSSQSECRSPASGSGTQGRPSAVKPVGAAGSLLRYSPALILLAIMLVDAGRRTDPDLWGHLCFGQAVLSQGHLTLHDPYSYSAPGHLWRNHEWLAEVTMAWLYNLLGVIGLKLMKLACSATTILFLVLAESETGASPSIQFNILIVAAVALMPEMQFRPQLFTFALLSALLWILWRHNCRGAAPLWLAVPMLALWANLHGGFIIGLAALGIYAVVHTLQDLVNGRGLRRGLGLIALAGAATIATLANPYGIGIWYAVAHALSNPVTRIAVRDWQPLLFAMIGQWHVAHAGIIYFIFDLAIMVGLGVAFALAPRGDDLPLAAIAGVMIAAAFVSVRNAPLAVIAASAPLARHAEMLLARTRREPREASPVLSGVANQIILTVVALLLAIETGLFSNRLIEDQPYPAGAVAFMKKHALNGNVLCNFNWGEYFIWYDGKRSKVFIDGRYDTVYPKKVIVDYINFYFNLGRAAEVLGAYAHDFVLIPPESDAYVPMTRRAGWKLIYRDPASALFARSRSPAVAIPNLPVVGAAPSRYFP